MENAPEAAARAGPRDDVARVELKYVADLFGLAGLVELPLSEDVDGEPD
ncbi:hypothetical protein [Dictyobacter kobayashii]|nr:hypothetical protein [Dictyobacter kobayashii]